MKAADQDQRNHAPEDLSLHTPQYIEDEHRRYVDYLLNAMLIEEPEPAINIALSGPYGSGKSSIIQGLRARIAANRYLNISIPTFKPSHDEFDSPDDGSETSLLTNQIQKEIVKQLIYRVGPSKVPGSRYRRLRSYGPRRMLGIASVLAGALLVFGFLTGATSRAEALANGHPLLLLVLWLTSFIAATCVITLFIHLIGNRLHVRGITAGPARIEIGDATQSTFDRNLDEIIYFFSVTSYDVVVFEDLDRFGSLEVFEELRELNLLLNQSEQIGRTVRFVYALRDNVFAQTQLKPYADMADQNEAGALRAKFFDVVVSVVPFATQRTSVDLWSSPSSRAVTGAIDPRLIKIAAAHIQDMRVVTSVLNDFQVFRREISRNPIDFRKESLFALMLYKAVHLDDFDLIRSSRSRLDDAEMLRRLTITEAVAKIDTQIRQLRARDEARDRLSRHAREFGQHLLKDVNRTKIALGHPNAATTLTIGKDVIDEDSIATVAFWRSLSEADYALTVSAGSATFEYSSTDIDAVLHRNTAQLNWKESDAGSDGRKITELEAQRGRVRSAQLNELLSDEKVIAPLDDFLERARHTSAATDELNPDRNLDVVLARALNSSLAFDLVKGGFIDENFSLYVSRFYGENVSATAINFVLHVAQPRIFAPDAALSSRDVEGVLLEAGPEVLSTRSALNHDIVNALLHDARIGPILDQLSAEVDETTDFLDGYMSAGAGPDVLLAKLARKWDGILNYAAHLSEIDTAMSVRAFEAVLPNLTSEVSYRVSSAVAGVLREFEESISTLAGEMPSDQAVVVADVYGSAGACAKQLLQFGTSLRSALIARGLFDLTGDNLETALGKQAFWPLDRIANRGDRVISLITSRMNQYLTILPPSSPTVSPTGDLSVEINRISSNASMADVAEFARRAAPNLRVETLASVPKPTWVALMATDRIVLSARNVIDYAHDHSFDAQLSKAVGRHGKVVHRRETTPEEREALAYRIALSNGTAPLKRARFIKSLGLAEPLLVSKLEACSEDSFSLLVREGVVPDSVETFDATRNRSWKFRLALFRRSRKVSTFASRIAFAPGELVRIFNSPDVPLSVKHSIAVGSMTLEPPLLARSSSLVARFIGTNAPPLSAETMRYIARAGCDEASLAMMVARYTFAKHADLLAILGAAQNSWAVVVSPGAKRPKFLRTNAVENVLSRLKAAGTIRDFSLEKGSHFRVKLASPRR